MLETANKFNKIHMIDHELRFNPNRKKLGNGFQKEKLAKNSAYKYFKCF